ncbi:ATP-dependent DNA helicase PIF1-like [Trichogramma pretiosum]|uniref:ATP-dependent DNA helicase PIF1-like n=1 Tax=Trichogramma pretiosum TaxID=7493 RepID=UPI000C719BBC|nr:ATP-dependent DNA helicase PIF1-like [Trichogramma pretiosum]
MDYWYRFQWQNLGSPHVHGLLYLQDEPEFIVNDLSEDHIHKIQEYFDTLCLAINPKSANPTCSNHPSQQRFSVPFNVIQSAEPIATDELNEEDFNRNSKSIIDKYIDRPLIYNDISLFRFAQTINVYGNRYVKSRKENVVLIWPKLKLSDDLDSDLYYKQQCTLHIPFRQNVDEISTVCDNNNEHPWYSLFEQYNVTPIDNIKLPISCIEDLDNEDKPSTSDIYYNAFEMVSSTIKERSDLQLGQRLIDVAYDWNVHNALYPSLQDIETFLKNFKSENATRSIKNSSNLQQITLSREQLKVVQICRTQIQHIQSSIGDISDQIIKRVIIQGKAGSGKRTLINAVVQEVTDALGCDAIAIIAPTGAAALNVNGSTIHSFFKIPIFHNKFEPLNSHSQRNFQLEHKALKFLIVDEMSMICAKTLGEIESRCHELFPSRDDSFAGLYVFMFGDYKQLSPVKDVALYNNSVSDAMATKGAIVSQSFQLFIELSISHRQGNDRVFSKLLDNLANGDISVDEYNILSQRKMSLLDETEKRRFDGAIHLIPTNDLVRQQNECCLRELGTPVLCINAQINGDVHKVNDDYCGLAPSLYLAIGCRVMLTQNIWVNGGLVNGSIGTVRAILYEENVSPPNLPFYVIIQFPLYHGPFIHDNSFPIKPVTRSYEKRGIICTIKQFPLKLAYAYTIHKAQGMTLPTAIIDIREREFSAGITYVALSRVRTLKDMISAG